MIMTIVLEWNISALNAPSGLIFFACKIYKASFVLLFVFMDLLEFIVG